MPRGCYHCNRNVITAIFSRLLSPSPEKGMGSTCLLECKMHSAIKKYKVGGKSSTHLFMAALFWTAIGLILLIRGIWQLEMAHQLIWGIPAILLGALKSYFVLDKAAKKNIDRILAFHDDTCLGAVFSAKTWLLIILMSGSGMILRHIGLPHTVLGFILMIIGPALILSSRHAWIAWRKNR